MVQAAGGQSGSDTGEVSFFWGGGGMSFKKGQLLLRTPGGQGKLSDGDHGAPNTQIMMNLAHSHAYFVNTMSF